MLEARSITAGYEGLDVIHDISMRIDKGQIVAIIGPNGSGKSTILKSIVGIVTPRRGKILLDDEDITGIDPRRSLMKGICMLPQGKSAFPMLTVFENLQMGAYTINNSGEIQQRLKQVYDMFPILTERRKDLARNLSGGEAAMLCIGRALMSNPKIMLLDEPSLGLAPRIIDYLYQKITEINRTGTSIVIVEQNVRKALKVAEYVYVVALGRKNFEGRPEELPTDDRLKSLYFGALQK